MPGFLRRLTLAAAALLLLLGPARAGCAEEAFEGNRYTICRFDLRQEPLRLYSLDAEGRPFGSFRALEQALAGQGRSLAFAMNAGMYDDWLRPIGLYIEEGRQLKRLNRRDGPGNFHLKPNGVFFLSGDRAGVMETDAFVRAGPEADYASQSGPMLVIDGEIHPKLSPQGQSRLRRNGVGTIDDHTVVFAISEDYVNFHSFARLFRDHLNSRNALYLDGSISSLHAPELGRSDGFFAMGPIVALVK